LASRGRRRWRQACDKSSEAEFLSGAVIRTGTALAAQLPPVLRPRRDAFSQREQRLRMRYHHFGQVPLQFAMLTNDMFCLSNC